MRKIDPSTGYRLFYPDVPAILCSSRRGRVSAMPVVSLIWLSNSPPLVGVSCHPDGATYKLVVASGSFSLCWLDKSKEKAISYLASHSGRGVKDKLVGAGLMHSRGRALGVPVIKESVAVLECRVSYRRRFGDHYLVVGNVEAASATNDFDEYWQYKDYTPVLYTGWQGCLTTYNRR